MMKKNLPKNLHYFRMINGFSMASLAQASSVSKKAICDIEAGKTKPHPSTVQKLAKALGVRIVDFYKPVLFQ